MKNNNKKERKNTSTIVIAILLLMIVIAISIASCSKINSNTSDYEEKVNEIVKIDYEKRQEALNEIVEEGMINICYSTNAIFKGTISKSFNVQNSINNHYDMVFEITDENDNIIYKSKKIKPGYEINSIELTQKLSKGVHECKIKIGYANEGNISSVFPITIKVE